MASSDRSLRFRERGDDFFSFPIPIIDTRDLNDPDLDERGKVIAALEQAGWVRAGAARLLGMTPKQIAYRIQILNIEVKRFCGRAIGLRVVRNLRLDQFG